LRKTQYSQFVLILFSKNSFCGCLNSKRWGFREKKKLSQKGKRILRAGLTTGSFSPLSIRRLLSRRTTDRRRFHTGEVLEGGEGADDNEYVRVYLSPISLLSFTLSLSSSLYLSLSLWLSPRSGPATHPANRHLEGVRNASPPDFF
jgi:hypothetical protein